MWLFWFWRTCRAGVGWQNKRTARNSGCQQLKCTVPLPCTFPSSLSILYSITELMARIQNIKILLKWIQKQHLEKIFLLIEWGTVRMRDLMQTYKLFPSLLYNRFTAMQKFMHLPFYSKSSHKKSQSIPDIKWARWVSGLWLIFSNTICCATNLKHSHCSLAQIMGGRKSWDILMSEARKQTKNPHCTITSHTWKSN